MPEVVPYGSWKSPLTADLIVARAIKVDQIGLDEDKIYWTERRPLEGGRYVLVQHSPDGTVRDVNPDPYYVYTRVHEYGGGAFLARQGTAYFVHMPDQRIYRQRAGEEPQAVTPESPYRYADLVYEAARDSLICVREDHSRSDQEAENCLVRLNLDGTDTGTILAQGYDFYAAPRLSPDGSQLAWLAWNHPNMPWDGTELWIAPVLDDGSLGQATLVTGGADLAIFQPAWSPEGTLHFVSEETGWWNLYRWQDGQIEALCPMEAEFGLPHWRFGYATYGFTAAADLICAYADKGIWHLARLDTRTQQLTPIPIPYTYIEELKVAGQQAVLRGGAPTLPEGIARVDLNTGAFTILRQNFSPPVADSYFSIPQTIEFPTEDNATAHAFYYPPHNPDFTAPKEERPPLIVCSHGGPTGSADPGLDLDLQYWTSRGFAVLDVNYRGSTGYGRAYRQMLNGRWGIVDVDDCINGAVHLVEQGLADGNRLAIRGGSAGGYTTLAALTFHDVFQVGASHFGVSDLELLAAHTHKFESRYLDSVIGPYPQQADLYRERSPIYHLDKLSSPLIFFQGLDDKVVPPEQAEKMFAALKAKGVPTAYLPFAGEPHGFRRAENIKRTLEAELYFYAQILGFALAEEIEPVQIYNL